jgi:Ca-activated chloride channel family protein
MPFSLLLRQTHFVMVKDPRNRYPSFVLRIEPATLFVTAAAATLAAGYAAAQTQALVRPFETRFRTEANLVLVPVTVTDRRSANINGLGKDSFAVLDNGRPQPISVFYTDDAPCSVGIVMDVSGSVKDTLALEKAAVHSFLQESNPQDDVFAVTFSSTPGPVLNLAKDASAIDNIVRFANAGGGTALFDTLYYALSQAQLRRGRRRALLVVSDGMDNSSHYSRAELMRKLVESDTQVYALAVSGAPTGVKAMAMAETQRGLNLMEDLAAQSGGMSVRIRDSQDPSTAATRLARALRNQYVIGYQPPDDGQLGKWHRIQIKVRQNRANVYARSGYESR